MIRKTFIYCALLLALAGGVTSTRGQGSAFSYQGRLSNLNGEPATGLYDLWVTLHAAANNSPNLASWVTNGLPVTNGLFTVPVNFGAGLFDGSPRWIELKVKTNGTPTFTTLIPRQSVLPTPYAMHAAAATTVANAAIGSSQLAESAVTSSKIASSQVVKSLNGLKDNVALAAGANVTITPNGNTLTVSSSGGGAFALNGASAYYNGGSVGIGTPNPAGGLQVASGGVAVTGASSPYSGTKGVYLESWDYGWGDGLGLLFAYDYHANVPMDLAINSPGGNVGIGTLQPREKLHVAGGYALVDGWGGEQAYIGGDGWSIDVQIGSFNPSVSAISAWNAGNNTWMDFRAQNIVANGSLTILGGADFAEPFQVSTKEAPKGAVMVIDEENPGQLKLSERAYDNRVAGIISGAGGVNPGITLQQEGVLEGGQNVALSGRVYVQADASGHPIKPGDLLTTSNVPGHAMKALDRDLAQGAIVGKAMTALNEGKGLVLVLVSLQ